MIRLAALAGALALALPGGAGAAPPDGAASAEVVEVPLSEAARALTEIRQAFRIRGDRRIAAARVLLDLDGPGERPAALDVRVNDGQVAHLGREALRGRVELPVDAALLGDRNQVALGLPARRDRACRAARGAWEFLRSAAVEVTTVPAELPDDLALLPLPFVDRDVDAIGTVPIVLGGAPTLERVRLAALAASWFGLLSGVPLRFAVEGDALPPRSALVLVDGEGAARALGLAPPDGPSIRVEDHPALGAAAKLVVVGGRTPDELRAALLRLAQGRTLLAGDAVALPPPERDAPARPYDAPRWVPPGRAVRLGDLTRGGEVALEAPEGGAVAVRFRIAPDLWIWPDETVPLDLRWTERLPGGAAPPEVDVELNGEFLARLPRPSVADEVGSGSVRLPVPRARLRGFDELVFRVRPAGSAGGCPELAGRPAEVRISPDSTLHVEGGARHAVLPDLSTFLYDGFPMSRVADLGETLAIVPDAPTPAEVATLLSIVAHLAAVTGRAATRLAIETPPALSPGALRDRDLLLVGSAGREPWSALARARWPLDLGADAPLVRRPEGASLALELLAGAPTRVDIARARHVLTGLRRFAVVEEIASPVTPGRTAVLVTATSEGEMPSVSDLLGPADSTTPAGDLLVAGDEGRWMFRVGPEFGTGALPGFLRLRWFLSREWLLLVPGLVLGALLAAAPLRLALSRRERERREGRR